MQVMQIIVVGAGIAGLSVALSLSLAGHRVVLVESASRLAEVGAGVQLTPCATKWLWQWGLGPDILAAATLPEAFNVRSAETGDVLGKVDFGDFEERYGGPYLVIHRADLHKILHEHAVNAGTEVKLNSRVQEYDIDGGAIKLNNGTEMHADLVIAVDGINSNARRQFVRDVDDNGLQQTGYAAFRMMADVSKVKANPLTEPFVSSQSCNCIAGHGCSIMTYMVKGEQKLNLVLSHLDNIDTAHWDQDRYRAEINSMFENFAPSARALLDAACSDASQTITNWPVYQVKPLKSWASGSGKFVLMGDAAHAMSFFLSMGVSLAVEDAAAFTECLSLSQGAGHSTGLRRAMSTFESVRLERTGLVRDASLYAGQIIHMPPGKDRDSRDRALRTQGLSAGDAAMYDDQGRHVSITKLSYGIVDQQIRGAFYGYDLKEHIQSEWVKSGRQDW